GGGRRGPALAGLRSKWVRGATTEISRRRLAASAIALAQADSAPGAYSSSFVDTRPYCASSVRARATLGISIFSTSCHCTSAFPLVNRAKRFSREKGRSSSTLAGRMRMPTPCRLLAARRRPRRALNVAITPDYWERRLDDGASSPLVIHVFDVAN